MSENRNMNSSRYESKPLSHVGHSNRSLHLLDLENLVGDPSANASTVAKAINAYRSLAEVVPGDHAVIAAHGKLLLEASRVWPNALLRVGRGPSGSDRRLLQEVEPHNIAKRFHRVVFGSGDGIFAGAARSLVCLGMKVLVVGRPGSVSIRLREAIPVRYLTITEGMDSDELTEVA